MQALQQRLPDRYDEEEWNRWATAELAMVEKPARPPMRVVNESKGFGTVLGVVIATVSAVLVMTFVAINAGL